MTMGCRELDYLILTHYDSDHVNGVEALFARMKVQTLLPLCLTAFRPPRQEAAR